MTTARNPQKPIRSYFSNEDMQILNDMREKLSAETDKLLVNPASFAAIIAHIKTRSETFDSLYAFARTMYARLFPKQTTRQELSNAFGFFPSKESPSTDDLFYEMFSYVLNYHAVYVKEQAAIAKEPRFQTIKFHHHSITFSDGSVFSMPQLTFGTAGTTLIEEYRSQFDAKMQRLADEQQPARQMAPRN